MGFVRIPRRFNQRKKSQGKIQGKVAPDADPKVRKVPVEGRMASKLKCDGKDIRKKYLHKLEKEPQAKSPQKDQGTWRWSLR